MKAVIVDYGLGNIRSLKRCIENSGFEFDVEVSAEIDKMHNADLLVIPGVGSWGAASTKMNSYRDDLRTLLETKPTLAVCLGMQLLFEKSEESHGVGIGLFEGQVTRLQADRVPQMGWNTIDQTNTNYETNKWAYFAHSYAVRPVDEQIVAGTTTYQDDTFPSVLRTPNLLATQFHPEKSDIGGLKLVNNFLKEVL